MIVSPGQIYMADLDGIAPHPVVIVSREELNRGRTVVAALITTARYSVRSTLANCVPFQGGQFGLSKDCVAQCENLLTLEVGQLDTVAGPLGMLDEPTQRELVRAVGFMMNADCELR